MMLPDSLNVAAITLPMRTAPVGVDRSLGDDLELVAGLEIAAHVDAILVDVGERPRELLARAGGQIVLRARVHRVVQIRRDRSADDDRVGRPRKRSSSPTHASPVRRRCSNRSIDELKRHLGRRRVGRFGLDRHRHAGGNAPLVERRRRLRARASPPCRSGRRGASSERSDSPRPSVSKRSFHDGVAACATSTSAGFALRIGKLGGKAKRAGQSQRDEGIQSDANDAELQSICLRMKVGISMSLRSCEPFSGAGRGGRGASVRGGVP